MCFAAAEAVFLAEQGFDDFLVAYPTVQKADLDALQELAETKKVRIVVDCEEHLQALNGRGVEAVVDLDVSFRPVGRVHLGVRRSPLRDPESVLRLLVRARALGVSVTGLMGYEAHVAGVPDANTLVRIFKRLAVPATASLRAKVVEAVKRAGFTLDLVNGGGTGSLDSTTSEACVTEVSAGSAFFAPHLFDSYDGLPLRPAAFFALQVVRKSDEHLATCHGGGWIASGGAGPDRLPLPWLPRGLKLLQREGAGEVQTPLEGAGALAVGDPVFFRHAKAGELSEHANELLLLQGDKVVERAPTYRGLGRAFV
jgi:D-serine deaminase-like pyridoxal phosphate-dependent protein